MPRPEPIALQPWSWFPWGVLRSAGFPIALVDLLDGTAVARAADLLLTAEGELDDAGARLRRWTASMPDATERRRFERAVKSRRPLPPPVSLEDPDGRVAAWNGACERHAAAVRTFEETYGRERPGATDRLRRGLAIDGLRRALLWQNRKVLPSLDKAQDGWDERVLLKYLTRYVTKNDTIGFFGPAAWIRASSEPGHAEVSCGPSIVARSHLSFEAWPIEAVAATLAQDSRLLPWLAPRRAAMCRVEGARVFMPPDCEQDWPAGTADVLRLCDGRRSARNIAQALGLSGVETIEDLQKAGLVTWTIECPLQLNPERAIRQLAGRVDDAEVRADLDEHAAWLSSVTSRLTAAMDSAAALDATLAAVDAEFETRYGGRAARGAGQYYAARTLTYLDCERDVSVTLHADALARLMTGLAPILASLRWYTHAIAGTLVAGVADLLPKGSTAPLASLYPPMVTVMMDAVEATADAYREKWRRVLPVDPSRREIVVDAEALAAAVSEEFAAPHPGWPMARLHNPDVLVAAHGADALAHGEYTLVLGEVHASLPSMFQSALFALCPDPDGVRSLCAAAVPPPPVLNETIQRLNLGEFYVQADQLLLPDEPVTHPRARPIADFDVVHADSGPLVRDVVNGHTWPVPVFFDALLARATFHLDPFDCAGHDHRPRLVVDRLVVAREAWRLRAPDVGVAERRRADSTDPARHFGSIRRWARDHQVPRYVFAKSSREPKPLFVDLESQAGVALLVHLLKQAQAHDAQAGVLLTEMLPRPDQCWLPDAAGGRYASELRLLAIDPVPCPDARTGAT